MKKLIIGCILLAGLFACKQENLQKPKAMTPQQISHKQTPPQKITNTTTPTNRPEPTKAQNDPWSWKVWNWEGTPVGKTPEQITAAKGDWKVAEDSDASDKKRVLAQVANNRSSAFNVAITHPLRALNVEISVALRAIKGKIDQGGGLIWRAKDAQNYYVARYNPLEDNLRLYTVQQGNRKMLQSADVRLDRKAWHTLSVQMQDQHIQVFLDGKKYLDTIEQTFQSAGMIGLWTKADANTYFRHLQAKPLPSSSLGLHDVSPSQLLAFLKKKDTVILDVRTAAEYTLSHIKGAKNLDVQNAAFHQQLASLDRNKKYIVHCSAGVPNGRGHRAFIALNQLNFSSVFHLKGGIFAWEQGKFPVQRKKN